MTLGLLMPLLGNGQYILGVPTYLLTLVVGLAGGVLGILWVRRSTRVDRYRSFRATDDRGTVLPLLAGLLAAGFLGLAALSAASLLLDAAR